MSRLIFIIFSLLLSGLIVFGAGSVVLNGSTDSSLQKVFLGESGQGLKALLAEKQALNSAIANARRLDTKIEELNEAKKSINPADLAKLDKFIPNHIDNINLIIDINNIAGRHGMQIKNVKVRSAEELESLDLAVSATASGQNTIADTSLSFSVSGPYESLIAFLDSLANSLRVADVQNLSFVVDDKGLNQYNFEIKTYWVK